MKKSIEWHEGCIKNSMESALRAIQASKKQIAFEQKAIERNNQYLKECEEYSLQVELAKKKGKTEFDKESFGKTKPRKADKK
jgi:hypothetical protein